MTFKDLLSRIAREDIPHILPCRPFKIGISESVIVQNSSFSSSLGGAFSINNNLVMENCKSRNSYLLSSTAVVGNDVGSSILGMASAYVTAVERALVLSAFIFEERPSLEAVMLGATTYFNEVALSKDFGDYLLVEHISSSAFNRDDVFALGDVISESKEHLVFDLGSRLALNLSSSEDLVESKLGSLQSVMARFLYLGDTSGVEYIGDDDF